MSIVIGTLVSDISDTSLTSSPGHPSYNWTSPEYYCILLFQWQAKYPPLCVEDEVSYCFSFWSCIPYTAESPNWWPRMHQAQYPAIPCLLWLMSGHRKHGTLLMKTPTKACTTLYCLVSFRDVRYIQKGGSWSVWSRWAPRALLYKCLWYDQ